MANLDQKDKLKLLRTMLTSRLGDLREQSLIRQGKGWFHVSAMGHEALAAAGFLLQEGDFFSGYYRDRALAIARGVDNYELALSFYAKKSSYSGGRQMPAHYSSRELGIFSISSVVGSSMLPATGLAWGLQLDGKKNLVLATIGDAGSRQGEFFEAYAFAIERNLPIVFIVEDNGIGISTITKKSTPHALGVLNDSHWQIIDGCDVDDVFEKLSPAFQQARNGGGPQFLWCRTERISSHSSADDHRKYRSEEELATLPEKDPINRLKLQLIQEKVLTEKSFESLKEEIEESVREDYRRAYEELDPAAEDLLEHVFGKASNPPALRLNTDEDEIRMVDAINRTFHAALESSQEFVFFGQDIEDPKGGVFSLTKGLSALYPDNVLNSPLAEATILGSAAGLACYGKRPVFEIQFIDFIWPGFNQLITQLSTLHWRSNGEWSAPAVIYAPYGAYLPGGAIWHSQTNESAIAHFPGIQIAIPSTPEDAAGLFWSALHGNSPTLVLIPKHLMWHPRKLTDSIQPVPFGKARVRRQGESITVVTWGNGTEVVQHAIELLGDEDAVEFIDLRTVVPLDLYTIKQSVDKTGRLLIVQEDAESCSVGQNIISRMVADVDLYPRLLAAPVLLAKPDVNIGYSPILEYAALPDKKAVARKIRELLSTKVAARHSTPKPTAADTAAFQKMRESFSDQQSDGELPRETIRVPILGEGITSARVVSLLVQAGDTFDEDDPLCEVETDKAMFPIEAAHEGKIVKWLISEEDEIEVDQPIVEIVSSGGVRDVKPPASEAESESAEESPLSQQPSTQHTEGGLNPRILAQLKNVVPAHMNVKAGWKTIRDTRQHLKESEGKSAPSPTIMVAWCLVRAMEKHPIFRCTITPSDTLQHNESFDFGIAVALDNDALETAVIPKSNTLSWDDFLHAYVDAVKSVRSGHSRSKAGTPLILTSMGGFSVRDAQPLVVPPAIATLFLGESHLELSGPDDYVENVSLCLSFDHRWMNGAAGASFLGDVKQHMENFTVPARTR